MEFSNKSARGLYNLGGGGGAESPEWDLSVKLRIKERFIIIALIEFILIMNYPRNMPGKPPNKFGLIIVSHFVAT